VTGFVSVGAFYFNSVHCKFIYDLLPIHGAKFADEQFFSCNYFIYFSDCCGSLSWLDHVAVNHQLINSFINIFV
jgi:hypothetical protein